MENSIELKALIRKNAHLFWYSKESEKENLPLPVVVEFFLNYANQEDIKSLFNIAGIEKVAEIFFTQINMWEHRSNYLPVMQNFFTLYFKKYVPQYS
ncbi:MAG: hypothetical protein H7Z13_21340 [Ferruginibacter sp.]|nr:hypothetical protein [Ferruginibacter sp.]